MGGSANGLDEFSLSRHSGAHRRCEPGISRFRGWSFGPSRNDGANLSFKLFAGDDLDAEAAQSLVVVHRRGQVADRGDAEIPQNLGADADLAPLPVAGGFGG